MFLELKVLSSISVIYLTDYTRKKSIFFGFLTVHVTHTNFLRLGKCRSKLDITYCSKTYM